MSLIYTIYNNMKKEVEIKGHGNMAVMVMELNALSTTFVEHDIIMN